MQYGGNLGGCKQWRGWRAVWGGQGIFGGGGLTLLPQTEHKMSIEEVCRKYNTDCVQVSPPPKKKTRGGPFWGPQPGVSLLRAFALGGGVPFGVPYRTVPFPLGVPFGVSPGVTFLGSLLGCPPPGVFALGGGGVVSLWGCLLGSASPWGGLFLGVCLSPKLPLLGGPF